MSIKISIVEDQPEMRESLVAWLGDAPGLRCVGAHATGEEALKKIPQENPDVVLMDINLTGMNGIQCVSRLKESLPKTQVLMLTTYDEGDMIFDSLRAGANGYLLKNMPQAELVEAVQQVHNGGAPMSLQITSTAAIYPIQNCSNSPLANWKSSNCSPKATCTRKSPTSFPSR
jgi:DNA-binding NarL/FixJ family response regulator